MLAGRALRARILALTNMGDGAALTLAEGKVTLTASPEGSDPEYYAPY